LATARRLFLPRKSHERRNAKHRAQWRMTLETYAAPVWNMPIDEIDTSAVLSVVQPIWQAKPETASRLRGRIEAVLDFAKAHGEQEGENPARWRGHLDKHLSEAAKATRAGIMRPCLTAILRPFLRAFRNAKR
jgi:hypothetical protein